MDFAVFRVFWEFRGISRKYLNFAGPRPREISEALVIEGFFCKSFTVLLSQLCVVLTTMFTMLLSVFVRMYNYNCCPIVDKHECFFSAEEESSVLDKGTIHESR